MNKISFSFLLVALGCLLIMLIQNINIVVIMPIIYIFSLLIINISKNENFRILKFSFEIMGLIRLVIIPFLMLM
ncbi:hypothetical protein BUY91_06835, partial [Staphylococcus equorum]